MNNNIKENSPHHELDRIKTLAPNEKNCTNKQYAELLQQNQKYYDTMEWILGRVQNEILNPNIYKNDVDSKFQLCYDIELVINQANR